MLFYIFKFCNFLFVFAINYFTFLYKSFLIYLLFFSSSKIEENIFRYEISFNVKNILEHFIICSLFCYDYAKAKYAQNLTIKCTKTGYYTCIKYIRY